MTRDSVMSRSLGLALAAVAVAAACGGPERVRDNLYLVAVGDSVNGTLTVHNRSPHPDSLVLSGCSLWAYHADAGVDRPPGCMEAYRVHYIAAADSTVLKFSTRHLAGRPDASWRLRVYRASGPIDVPIVDREH